jgi:hypothetical protein
MGKVLHLPTKTIPPVDWDAMLDRMLKEQPALGDARSAAAILESDRNATIDAAVDIMADQETKASTLAAKQARLIQTLRANMSAAPPANSSNSATSESPPNAQEPPRSSSAQPETEADGTRAEALRRLHVRRLFVSQPPGSSK